MAKVHVCNVLVLDNPSKFLSKFEFEITFECLEDLPEDLEWKIVYVGSAESEEYDQILDTVYVGPVPEGRHKFVFTAEAPDPKKIPTNDIVGVTVILLTCSYREQEFIRVGYYVSNEYEDPELAETPPAEPQLDKLKRSILASNPRVTKFKINWENQAKANGEGSAEAAMDANGDGDKIPHPSDNENIPPMPNEIPPNRDAMLDSSPMKTGLKPDADKIERPRVRDEDSMGMMDFD